MTDKIFYEGELNEKRISAYKKLAENYRIQEGTVRDIFSQGIAFTVSHTAAHTASLREDNAKLAHFNEVINTECTRIRIELGEETGRVAALREENDTLKEELSDERILLEAARKQLSAYEERVKELGAVNTNEA